MTKNSPTKTTEAMTYCFSPVVMLATFSIEFFLAILALYRYRFVGVVRPIVIALVCLGIFQLSEYFSCGGVVGASMWSRLGYASIGLLPPLGLHIIQLIRADSSLRPTQIVYGLAIVWVVLFGFVDQSIAGHVCSGNYVVFQLHHALGFWHNLYYMGILLVGLGFAVNGLAKRHIKKKAREALIGMMVGYAVFILPTGIVNVIDPATLQGVPSIMCGFAILFALILYGYVLPRVGIRR